MGQGDETTDIGGDHRFPFVQPGLLCRFGSQCQSGVVDQHVDRLKVLRQRGQCGIDRCFVGHIQADRQQLVAKFLVKLFQTLDTPRRSNDPMAVTDEFSGHFLAKTGAGTRNQNDHENSLDEFDNSLIIPQTGLVI